VQSLHFTRFLTFIQIAGVVGEGCRWGAVSATVVGLGFHRGGTGVSSWWDWSVIVVGLSAVYHLT